MIHSIKKSYILGTIFTILFGTILHYVYKWSGNNPLVGIFGAVNESTWEHLKLLFWPAFIFTIAEYIIIGKDYNNYITAKAASFFVGIALIVSLFYTYTGIIGDNYLALDILVFLISVIISQYIGYKITVSNHKVSKKINSISLIAIVILVVAFIRFTFNTPQISLFKDPITGKFGI